MNRSDRILAWAVTMFVLLICAAVALPSLAKFREGVTFIRALPFGWIGFLRRTVPEVTINWAGIGMVVLCSALILLCLHWLFNALTQKRFRFRWSLSIFASIWLLFCLIIAVAGLSRTTALLKGERWYERRLTRGDLRSASMQALMALHESENDLNRLKPLLFDSSRWRPWWEDFEFLVCPTSNSKALRIVVIPREAKARDRLGFSIVAESGSEDFIPTERLQEKLASLGKSVE